MNGEEFDDYYENYFQLQLGGVFLSDVVNIF